MAAFLLMLLLLFSYEQKINFRNILFIYLFILSFYLVQLADFHVDVNFARSRPVRTRTNEKINTSEPGPDLWEGEDPRPTTNRGPPTKPLKRKGKEGEDGRDCPPPFWNPKYATGPQASNKLNPALERTQ